MNTNKRNGFISCVAQKDGSIDITIPACMAEEFKLLVKRGTNTYPSKHVEIMDFADRLMGRDSFSGACMKQDIMGYPRYPQKDIVSSHWDIPSEDKFELAKENTNPCLGCGSLVPEVHRANCPRA